MVGPSKILTVSYGTFSCTLEGFDNPFSTMRGIAEYFRDLAADDRYFGAEPPIPDAEMLHRIAEADAHKRVEAHVEKNGVTLRQIDENLDSDHAPAAEIITTPKAQISDPFIDEPADIVALNEPSLVEAESVAAKLARIRAVVSNESVATEQENDGVDALLKTSPISAAFADSDDTVTSFLKTDAALETDTTPEAEEDNASEAEADADVETVTEIAAETAEDTGAETVATTDADTETTEDAVKADANLSAAGTDPEPTADITADAADDDDSSKEDTGEPAIVDRAEITDDDAGAGPDTASIAQFMGDAADDAEESPEETEEAGAAANLDSSAISRVIKMRRTDFDAAQDNAKGANESLAEYVENFSKAAENDISSLTPEDEAELMSNLEQVQRKADAEERADKEGRALLENQNIEASTESVNRILDVTNTELEKSEGTRRRSAIAHLKAAVAATRADKLFSNKREQEEQEELNQYRDDLAKVVKPRRPADSGKSARQAPLMLVSEQRVDQPAQNVASDGASIQPRRISAGNLALSEDDLIATSAAGDSNIFVENNTFADFAAEMGAHELPDLLEAAAAYSAYIEGNAHFSRPQIMQAVAAIQEQEFTREEGLRSFGLLLRRGKIKKLKRGQFTIADTTRFHPQPRAVGQ